MALVIDDACHDAPTGLCRRCEALDLVSQWRTFRPEQSVAELGCPRDWAISACVLCRLFHDFLVLHDTGSISHGIPSWMLTEAVFLEDRIPTGYSWSDNVVIDYTIAPMVLELRPEKHVLTTQGGHISIAPNHYGRPQASLHARAVPATVPVGLLRGWLEACERRHDRACGLGPRNPVSSLWLIDCTLYTTVRANANYHYVALSYVWGSTYTPQHLDLHNPPRTIRDAMEVTRELGFQYLWVDKYCIRSNDAEHMVQQIRQMHRIYEQAFVTIIAAAGTNSDHGLPGVAGLRREQHLHATIGEVDLLDSSLRSWADLNSSAWKSRAWTLQEGALSRRRLIFTDRQAHFECLRGYRQESLYDPLSLFQIAWEPAISSDREWCGSYRCFSDGTILDEDNENSYRDTLADHINDYACRDLTYDSDVLSTFTGMMQKYEETGKYRFHWVMPYNIRRAHAQRVSAGGHFLKSVLELNWFGLQQRRSTFPSWSWAGWKTGIVTSTSSGVCHGASVSVELLTGAVIPWVEYINKRARSSSYLHVEGLSGFFEIKSRYDDPSESLNWFDVDFHVGTTQRPMLFQAWGAWSKQDDESRFGEQRQIIVTNGHGLYGSGTLCLVLEAHDGFHEVFGVARAKWTLHEEEKSLLPRRTFRIG